MDRNKFPPADLQLRRRHGDYESWDQEAMYELVYQLSRIADSLEGIRESLPMAGKGF